MSTLPLQTDQFRRFAKLQTLLRARFAALSCAYCTEQRQRRIQGSRVHLPNNLLSGRAESLTVHNDMYNDISFGNVNFLSRNRYNCRDLHKAATFCFSARNNRNPYLVSSAHGEDFVISFIPSGSSGSPCYRLHLGLSQIQL